MLVDALVTQNTAQSIMGHLQMSIFGIELLVLMKLSDGQTAGK